MKEKQGKKILPSKKKQEMGKKVIYLFIQQKQLSSRRSIEHK